MIIMKPTTDFEALRHPFSKKKIKPTDVFESNKNMSCVNCGSVGRPIIYCIGPDGAFKEYYVVKCKGCEHLQWYIPKL